MNKIPYDEIDTLCIPLVKFFNSIGLTTQFCCQGHETGDNFYIVFDESVSDKQIDEVILKYRTEKYYAPYGQFYKWRRNLTARGGIVSNWMYQVDHYDYKTNQKMSQEDLKVFLSKY